MIFGLSQLWYVVGENLFSQESNFDMFSIIKDGVLLFFILALTISLTLDFWFEHAQERINLAKLTAFVFYPLLITISVVSVYSYVLTLSTRLNKEIFKIANLTLIVLSFVYALVVKTYFYYKTDFFKEGGLEQWN